MVVCGLDIGGASTNGICVMSDSGKIIKVIEVPFKGKTKGEHRRFVASLVRKVAQETGVTDILLEAVRLYRGGHVSPLADIMSLGKITGAIIDSCCDICEIHQVQVNSWKARVLGNKSATKEDAVNFVKKTYGLNVCHDVADSICIARCGIYFEDVMKNKNNLLTNK